MPVIPSLPRDLQLRIGIDSFANRHIPSGSEARFERERNGNTPRTDFSRFFSRAKLIFGMALSVNYIYRGVNLHPDSHCESIPPHR
jgi:hypothetical protein